MNSTQAIEAIRENWPGPQHSVLREALTMAIQALESQDKNRSKTEDFDKLERFLDKNEAVLLGPLKDDKIFEIIHPWTGQTIATGKTLNECLSQVKE